MIARAEEAEAICVSLLAFVCVYLCVAHTLNQSAGFVSSLGTATTAPKATRHRGQFLFPRYHTHTTEALEESRQPWLLKERGNSLVTEKLSGWMMRHHIGTPPQILPATNPRHSGGERSEDIRACHSEMLTRRLVLCTLAQSRLDTRCAARPGGRLHLPEYTNVVSHHMPKSWS